MARIRTIKPEAFTSQTLAKLSLTAERTFLGLLTQADDEGRIKAGAATLNGALWAEREEFTPHSVADMKRDLDELSAPGVGLLCRYTVAGRDFMHLPTFLEHQKINRPTPSKIPACPESRCAAVGVAGVSDQMALPEGFA